MFKRHEIKVATSVFVIILCNILRLYYPISALTPPNINSYSCRCKMGGEKENSFIDSHSVLLICEASRCSNAGHIGA